MSTPLLLDPGHAALTQWRDVIDGASITLSAASADAIAAAQAIVDDIVAAGTVTYGVNTGFGKLASVRDRRIGDLADAAASIIILLASRSGTGPAACPTRVVRLILAIEGVRASARGASGVRPARWSRRLLAARFKSATRLPVDAGARARSARRVISRRSPSLTAVADRASARSG